MSHRIPFPWEDSRNPLDEAGTLDLSRVVAMPAEVPSAPMGHGLEAGEIASAVSPRDTRAALERQLLDHTDGSESARQWAREKAAGACESWDRGVRSGSIKRHN